MPISLEMRNLWVASRIFSSMALTLLLIAGSGCAFVIRTGGTLTEASCDTSLRFQGGDGTSWNPYQICAPEHFQNLGNTAGFYYKLTADIDLSTVSRIASFSGTLDGNGQTISGYTGTTALFGTATNITIQDLTVDRFVMSGSGIQSAMMDSATNAIFTNITLRNLTATGTSDFGFLTGSCVSCNAEEITLEDSVATGTDALGGVFNTISNTTRGLFKDITVDNVMITTNLTAGGIVASATNIEFVNVSVSATIVGVGGGLIANSLSNSDVISVVTAGSFSGDTDCAGVVGTTSGSEVKMIQVNNNAIITCSGDNAGGLVAMNTADSLLVTRSTNTGPVSCSSNCGGFIGRNRTPVTIAHVKSTGAVSGDVGYIAGIVGQEQGGIVLSHAISTARVSGVSDVNAMVDSNGVYRIFESYFDQVAATTSGDAGATATSPAGMLDAATYWSFEDEVFWNITDGSLPTLRTQDLVTNHVVCDPSIARAGSGTSGDPYRICDSSHLTAGLTGYMKIVRDLSLAEVSPWDALSAAGLIELNGDNRVILGMNTSGTSGATGLVGSSTAGATYKLTHLHGGYASDGATHSSLLVAGPLVGTIEDSTVSGLLSNLGGGSAGGLTGNLRRGTIVDSKAYVVATDLGDTGFGGAVGNIESDGTASLTRVTAAIRLTDPNDTGGENIGGLVGTSTIANAPDVVTISSCSASGSITGNTAALEFVGGLVGRADAGTGSFSIGQSSSSVNISSSGTDVGGLVGRIAGATLTRSVASGTAAGGRNIGGAIGFMTAGAVSRTYASGDTTCTSCTSGHGGFIGRLDGGTIEDSYASGNATSTNVGGFLGTGGAGTISRAYASGLVTISGGGSGGGFAASQIGTSYADCIFDTTTTTQGTTAGSCTGLATADMLLNATYAAWDFINIWNPPGGTAYPTLRY